MQPLEPFHILQSEDPQVGPKCVNFTQTHKICPKCVIFAQSPKNRPRRVTTARLGSLLGFNACCFLIFFINICQQVSRELNFSVTNLSSSSILIRPSLPFQSSWFVSTSWQCTSSSQVKKDISPCDPNNFRVGIILTHGILLIHMTR